MHRHLLTSLAATFLIPIGIAAEPPALWQGVSAGYRISWTSADLQIRRSSEPPNATPAFDAKSLAESEWKQILADADPKENRSTEIDYTLLSVVGPILSYQYGHACECGGAHADVTVNFETLNLQTGKPASLLDFFPAETLFRTLMRDPVVKATVGDNKPSTLDQLNQFLAEGTYEAKDCSYSFGSYLTQFAFFSQRPGFVSVRIAVPAAIDICRGRLIQIGLELPVTNPALKAALSSVNRGNGVLMGELTRKLPRNSKSHFAFSSSKGRSH